MDGRKNLIFMFYLLKRGSIVLSIVAFELFANFGNKKSASKGVFFFIWFEIGYSFIALIDFTTVEFALYGQD